MTTISVRITAEMISDQFTAAFEGGSHYWCQSAELLSSPIKPKGRWYGDQEVFDHPFSAEIGFDDPEKPEGNGEGRKVIGQEEVSEGLRKMAAASPWNFADMIGERGDAGTADVFLQFVLFGEVVYG